METPDRKDTAMKQDFFYPSKDKITRIHAIRWVPEGTPRAILQICHGMQEYIDRYDDFASFRGWEYRSKLVDDLACGSYNKRFEPARTAHDWLTKDTAIVDKYEADPWCMFRFTLNAYYNMFCGIQEAQSKEKIQAIPKDLPLLLVSGAEDPVGSFGKGVEAVQDQHRQCGIRDVRMKLYEGDRHEILNETDRQ